MANPIETNVVIKVDTAGDGKLAALSREVAGLGEGAGDAAPEFQRLAEEIDGLAAKERLVGAFAEAKRETVAYAEALQTAQAATRAAAQELRAKQATLAAATTAEREAAAALGEARTRHDELKVSVAAAAAELKSLRTASKASGADTAEYAGQIREARTRLAELRKESATVGQAVRTLAGDYRPTAQALKEAGSAADKAQRAFEQNRHEAGRAKTAYEAQRLALHNTRQALASAGIASTDLAGAQVRLAGSAQQAAQRAGELRARLASVGSTAQAAGAQTEKGFSQAAKGVRSISEQLSTVQSRLLQFAGAQLGLQTAIDLGRTADEYANLGARIDLVNSSQAGFNLTLAQTAELARATYSGLESTTGLVGALARAGEEVGLTQEGVLRLTESINKANQVSGASAASADAALTQLIQGLQSGTLRGDEFNSVMEQSPRLAKALADGLGVPIGALRAMAEQGKLTSEVVISALQSQARTIDAEFAKLPLTIGRSLTNLSTNWTQFIGELDQANGASATVARALEGVANNLDDIAKLAVVAGEVGLAVFAAKLIPQVTKFGAEALAATKGVGGLRAGLAALPGTVKIALAVVGYEVLTTVGKAIGETVASWGEAGDAMRRAEQTMREATHSMIANGQTLAYQNDAYRNAVVLTAGEVARLSEAERTAYFERLDGARKYYAGAQMAIQGAKELGIASEFSAEQTAAGMKRAREGMAAFEVGVRMSRAEIEALLSVDASLFIAQFDELAAKGKDAAAALQEVGQGFDASALESVQGFGQALVELRNTGKISADEMGAAWQQALAKLDGAQLSQFMITAQAAFGQSQRDVEALAAAMDGALRTSIAATGQDFAQLSSGISSGAQSALGHLATLEAGFDKLKAAGVDTNAALIGAIDFAVEAGDSAAALTVLRQDVERLGREGKLSADQVAEAIEKIGKKADEVQPGINSVEEAFRKLGVTSQKEMDRAAADAKQAFEVIRDSGKATAEELRAAFTAYAEQAVAANGGVADATVKAQASALGLAVEVDKTGKVIVQTMAEAAFGVKGTDKALKDAAGSADKLGEAAKGAGKSMVEAAREQNAAVKSVTVMLVDATTAQSRYADEAKRVASAVYNSALDQADSFRASAGAIDGARAAARLYIEEMERLDARQQEFSSNAAEGVEQLRLRLLELNGTEEQIASARQSRDQAEVLRTIELTRLDLRRAELRKDAGEVERLQREINLLQEQLGLIDQIYRAERRNRSNAASPAGMGGTGATSSGSAGGAGVQAAAPSQTFGARQTTLNINLPGSGIFSGDRASLEAFARQLGPVITDLQRKGAL
ncbi:MAG: tape measure protein [Thauera sp.]|nr:tape measure protein [Thauera sp.]